MKLLSGLFIGIFSTSITAATFIVPDEFQLLRLNEESIEKSWFSNTSKLELSVGEHLIKLKYLDVFEEEYDQHEVVESQPFWLRISIEESHQELIVEFERPSTIAKAKSFSQIEQKPLFIAGKPLVVYTSLPLQELMDSHAMGVGSEDKRQSSKPDKFVIDENISVTQPSALKMLEFWWLQATPEEQKVFLHKAKLGNK